MGINLTQFATDLISNLGYGGLFMGLFLDSFGIPIPSEVLIPVATILAEAGRFNLWAVFFIGTIAQVLGGLVSYYIGKIGGRPAVDRFGRYVMISKRDLDKTHAVFETYGPLVAAGGRCIPVIRGLVGYPAGVAEMPIWQFVGWTALGSGLWTAILMGVGLLAAEHLEAIEYYMTQFSLVLVILLLLAFYLHYRHAINERRLARKERKAHKS